MKVSERLTEAKKAEKKYFPQSFRKLISCTGSKNNKEVNLKTRKHISFTENFKFLKLQIEMFRKLFSGKSSKEISPNSVSPTVLKKMSSYAC